MGQRARRDHRDRPGAGRGPLDDLVWRLSVATLAEPGPFSSFPGLDRTLLLIDDAEVDLEIDGTPVRLTRFGQVGFAGESATRLVAASGVCRDLNIMCRRGRVRGRVTPFRVAGEWPAAGRDAVTAWVFVRGTCALTHGGVSRPLDPLDTIVTLGPPPWTGEGDAVLVEIEALRSVWAVTA